MSAIYTRELKAYFKTPIGYIFIGMFLVVSGFMFSAINLIGRSPNIDSVLGNLLFVFLFLVPVLTMRLLSEEKNLKTDQVLLTSPVSVTGIVLGKFFAAVTIYLITLLISGIYIIVIAVHGAPAYMQILTSYIGFALLGTAFISIGIFISSLTENQAVSAVSTFAVLLILYIINWASNATTNVIVNKIIDMLSITSRYNEFNIGILSLPPIIYYLSVIGVFIFLTIRAVERRRWS
jgi:ABC-2 type transport system permease protein